MARFTSMYLGDLISPRGLVLQSVSHPVLLKAVTKVSTKVSTRIYLFFPSESACFSFLFSA